MKMFRGAAVAAAIAGSMAAYNAQAVNLATDGIGEVAIAPFYTVRDGWSTLINLTNTQNAPVAVKVRFHEAHNSRDVLDFLVLLSANDVFTGIVTEDANGNAVFRSTDSANNAGDRTCTIPTAINIADSNGNLPNVQLSSAGFRASNADNDRGDQTNDRLKEGYIEFIVMGYAEPNLRARLAAGDPLAAPAIPAVAQNPTGNGLVNLTAGGPDVLDVGYAIEEHNCDAALERAFTRENGPAATPEILWTARQFGESINSLKFNFRLINVERGVEAGNSATTWANFYNPGAGAVDAVVAPGHNTTCNVWRGAERGNTDVTALDTRGTDEWDPSGVGGYYNGAAAAPSCRNLIAEQQRQSFLEPTLNDAFPIVGNAWDDQLNAAVNVTPAYNTTVIAPAPPAGAYAGGTLRGIDAMSATIMRRFVVNEWADNSAAGVSTDWIITQPTKGFYVDDPNMNFAARGFPPAPPAAVTANEAIQAQQAFERYEALVAPGTAGAPSGVLFPAPYSEYWGENAAGQSCNEVGFTFFDRAEQTFTAPGSGVIVSPQLPETVVTDVICHESMIVNFNNASAFTDAGAMNAQNRINVDTSALPNARNGWMLMDLSPNGESLPVAAIGGDDEMLGLPVIGFNLKVRSLGNAGASTNYASTLDHGYIRETTN